MEIQDPADFNAEPMPDKISAYYSLVFSNYTYYLQTTSVTIGRRAVRNSAGASTSDTTQADVDLGALKSVSRLHARIDYEEESERYVLVILGRNGAWVDGVWSGSGSRVPLGARYAHFSIIAHQTLRDLLSHVTRKLNISNPLLNMYHS